MPLADENYDISFFKNLKAKPPSAAQRMDSSKKLQMILPCVFQSGNRSIDLTCYGTVRPYIPTGHFGLHIPVLNIGAVSVLRQCELRMAVLKMTILRSGPYFE